jgi:hypothetical protein
VDDSSDAGDESGNGNRQDAGNDDEYVYEEDDDVCDVAVEGIPGAGSNCDSTWLSEYYMKKKWMAKEAELRDIRATNQTLLTDNASVVVTAKKSVCDLFSPEASSKVLMSDLLAIMRECKELGYEVTAIDDDIYNWSVKIHRVNADCPLAMDLIMLDDSYG